MHLVKGILPALMLLFSALGCGHTGADIQPLVDGPKKPSWTSDLSDCQDLARQKSYINDDVKSDALIGGTIGLVAGALSDGLEGAAVGAAAGGLIAGGGKAWETREQRSAIVCECMRQRGHRVVEY